MNSTNYPTPCHCPCLCLFLCFCVFVFFCFYFFYYCCPWRNKVYIMSVSFNLKSLTYWRAVCCRQRVWCNSVTWRCLHGPPWVLNNLEVQYYNTSTTDRHRRQGLGMAMWHRRLWANVSAVCRRRWMCLASVVRRRRHKALAVKVSVRRRPIHTADTVSDVNSPSCDVTLQSTFAFRRRRRWTETCSTAGRHSTTSRRGVTNWNIYCHSQQPTAGPGWGCGSQHWRWSTASVQRSTSTLAGVCSARRRWLSRSRNCSRPCQSSYSAARRSPVPTSRHHRQTSTELRGSLASVLQRTIRTAVGWVVRRSGGVWCALPLDELFNLRHFRVLKTSANEDAEVMWYSLFVSVCVCFVSCLSVYLSRISQKAIDRLEQNYLKATFLDWFGSVSGSRFQDQFSHFPNIER